MGRTEGDMSWLIPATCDGEGGTNIGEGREKYRLRDQAVIVDNWQTPEARNNKGYHNQKDGSRIEKLGTQAGTGKLNPDWVSQLMGLPAGWTQLNGATDPHENRIDRLRLLGNGVVPQTAEKAFRTLLERATYISDEE